MKTLIDLLLAWLRGPAPEAPAAPPTPKPEPALPGVVMPALLPRDEERLQGVHADLVRVIRRARKSYSFVVTEGLRTRERQAELVAKGASQTMNSRHITGHAVDLAVWVDSNANGVPNGGEIRWDWPLYDHLGAAVKKAAEEEGVPIKWGGDWATFRDGPHFELCRKAYPA